jgi:hypothetical protein
MANLDNFFREQKFLIYKVLRFLGTLMQIHNLHHKKNYVTEKNTIQTYVLEFFDLIFVSRVKM